MSLMIVRKSHLVVMKIMFGNQMAKHVVYVSKKKYGKDYARAPTLTCMNMILRQGRQRI